MAGAEASSPVVWFWGTNRCDGVYYAGRTHVVHPERRSTGLCGLPVSDVWELRPPMPEHLCPDCCVLAMAASYPPFPTTPSPRRAVRYREVVVDDWFAPPPADPAEQPADQPVEEPAERTVVLPALRDGDP